VGRNGSFEGGGGEPDGTILGKEPDRDEK